MAIDKEFLKKQNAKKVYNKRHTKKSTDFDLNISSSAKSAASYDLNDTKEKKYKGSPTKNIAKQARNGLSCGNSKAKSDNENVSESTVNTSYNTAHTASKSVYGVSKKAVNAAAKTPDTVSAKTENTASRSAVSHKSNMLNGNVSGNNGNNHTYKNSKKPKKSRYKKSRKKVFKKKQKNVYEEKIKKEAVKKTTSACTKVIAGIVSFAVSNYLLVLPLVLIIIILTGASFSEDEVKYTYPASEIDITNTIELWQSLQVDLRKQHSIIPDRDGIKGKFTDKKSEICEFMNDNDKLLSFVSAYKILYTDSWHYEDISDLVTDIFNEMYGLDAAIADNVLTYRIVEKKSWDDILKSYLNDEQMEKYNDYYEHKGGLVKALSSPFGFDWSGYITSPFGYRTWGDGSTEYHKGVDFGVPHGTPILSVSDGVVQKIFSTCTHDYPKDSSCGCGGGYGNYVDVLTDNGELFITYGHMDSVYVNVGDKIKNGQVVGTVGCTGWSTGNHLHLETRSQTAYGELLDPLTIIKPFS